MELHTLLEAIKSPEDIKNLNQKQISNLEKEIRNTIIDVVGRHGGHLASNLGVVELTVALHRVFDSPKDAIIFDVSHQCYAHKLLTGRYEKFETLRQKGGLSGFTRHEESVHDYFDNGHASTSISQGLGLLTAWNLTHRDGYVVCVIGDGALTGGMSIEALSNAGQLQKNLIVIVNDNQMSIDENTGAISSYLSRISMTPHYQRLRRFVDRAIGCLPILNRPLTKFIYRFKRGLKGLLLSNNLFCDFGFDYVGPLDGHNERELEVILRRVKKMNRPVVVHVVTKKGRGYSLAEDHPERFHGIGPFCITDGTVEKYDTVSFTESFSNSLMKLCETKDNICCITAAMGKGTGLAPFSRKYPSRFFDVGIAEEHAVTFAGGLARGGILPIVCIYSTFMQRSVDQIIHDIALQDLHAILMLDRSGAVPGDGETHQGIFDIALFRPIPKVTIMSPSTSKDLDLCLNYAVKASGTIIIRYPKATCPSELPPFTQEVIDGKGVLLTAEDYCPTLEGDIKDKSSKLLIVCTGGMFSEVLMAGRSLLMDGVLCDIYTLRFIKPLDEDYFKELSQSYKGVVFVEDGIITGGVSLYLQGLLSKNGYTNTKVMAFPESFLSHGNRAEVLNEAHLSSEDIKNQALNLVKK